MTGKMILPSVFIIVSLAGLWTLAFGNSIHLDTGTLYDQKDAWGVGHVHCFWEPARENADQQVIMLQISKRDAQGPIAYIKENSLLVKGEDVSIRHQVIGSLKQGDDSKYLNVTILNVNSMDSGIYDCSVVYLDEAGFVTYAQSSKSLVRNRLSGQLSELKDLKEQVADLKKRLVVPAFSAIKNVKHLEISNGMTVVFDEVTSSDCGYCYNKHNGTFIAPYDGLYFFYLTIELEPKGAGAGFNIMVRDTPLVRLYVEDKDYGDQSTVNSLVILAKGDTVYVKVKYETKSRQAHIYSNKYSSFGGFLVKRY